MNKKIDAYLSHLLKKWVSQQSLPEDGRERLLQEAARPHFWRKAHLAIIPNVVNLGGSASPFAAPWPQRDFNWAAGFWFENEVTDTRMLWGDAMSLRVS